MVILVDFGGQTAHLIRRRLEDLGATVLTVSPKESLEVSRNTKPSGIVLSGGPASVYAKGAPSVDPRIFTLDIPVLAICYGMQLTAHLLGGKVTSGKVKEFGPANLVTTASSKILNRVPSASHVWMSHGDTVVTPPAEFSFVGHTDTIRAAVMTNEKTRIYCVQFHPEVAHTTYGTQILKNFLALTEEPVKIPSADIRALIADIKKTIGKDSYAIAAVSGGLDSTVAATLVALAIGKRLIPVHIDSGFMRDGTTDMVKRYFSHTVGIQPIVLHKHSAFLSTLHGICDPETKRKRIGKLYIQLFNEVLTKFPTARFLVQGTIYSDVIESKGTQHAATIKSHHNVGGLPKNMKLTLIEPIRNLYTDQVRVLAKKLGIDHDYIHQQPHPGPGYAIRIVGEVTKKRLAMVKHADTIVVSEMKKAGLYTSLLHSFAVATASRSTSVRGDGRGYGEVIAIRAVQSTDRMTATWPHIPYTLLQTMSSRIVNEVPGVSRVVYDITTKPPATIEWE